MAEGRGTQANSSALVHLLSLIYAFLFFPPSFSSSKSTRCYLLFFLNAPGFLFPPSFASFYPPLLTPPTTSSCWIPISLSLFFLPPIQSPSVDLVRVVWFRHQRGSAGAFMHYTTLQSRDKKKTKQQKKTPLRRTPPQLRQAYARSIVS